MAYTDATGNPNVHVNVSGPASAWIVLYRHWLARPGYDAVAGLVALALWPMHLAPGALWALIGASVLAWTIAAMGMNRLRPPLPGFPDGLPARTRKRLWGIIAYSVTQAVALAAIGAIWDGAYAAPLALVAGLSTARGVHLAARAVRLCGN